MMLEDACCYSAAEERPVVGKINLHAEPDSVYENVRGAALK